MLTPIKRSLHVALALLIGAFGLQAQVDPNLATSTDLLNVYNSGGGAKPEMLTIFDFSGSMGAMYWADRYWANANQSNHGAGWTYTSSGGTFWHLNQGDWEGLIPVIDTSARIRIKRGTGYYQSIVGSGWIDQFVDETGATSYGQLIQPDGNLVSIGSGPFTQTQLTAYVQQASHVRIKARATLTIGGASQVITRQIDLPLPWAVFNRASSTSASNILKLIHDPGSSTNSYAGAQDLYVDTMYALTSQNNIVNDDAGRGYKIGRFHYNYDYLWWIFFGTQIRNADGNGETDTGKFIIPAVASYVGGAASTTYEPSAVNANKAWDNGVISLTRYQALKQVMIQSWVDNQDKLFWGYRMFDQTSATSEEGKDSLNTSNSNGSASDSSRFIRLFKPAVTSSNPDVSIKQLQELAPSTGTPLTYAYANALAQMSIANETQSAFGPQPSATGESPIPNCRQSFVVLFTDGLANDSRTFDSRGNGNEDAVGHAPDAYLSGATDGNTYVAAHTSQLNPSQSTTNTDGLFNIWTLAGVSAHYGTKDTTTNPNITGALSGLAPFRITNRGASADKSRRVRTMSVGMSLAGTLTDTSSGKADLYRAALYGNPKTTTWSPLPTPYNPDLPDDDTNDPSVNPFFFDATDPGKLGRAVTTILNEVLKTSTNVSAPSAPLVGLNLGNRAYLGNFQPNNSVLWSGDLLMSGIQPSSDGTVDFLDQDGNPSTNITPQNAVATGSLAIKSMGWKNRRIYYVEPNTTIPSGGIDLTGVSYKFDESNTSLTQTVLGVSTAASRLSLIRFIRGASTEAQKDAASPTSITANRTDIMGDIINSAPAAIEYDSSLIPAGSTLATAWTTVNTLEDPRFRVIYVGDNQGLFHCFGEVSGFVVTGAGATLKRKLVATMEELWAFVPPEFLNPAGGPATSKLKKLQGGLSHIYLVDGTPHIFFKDTPLSGKAQGDLKAGGPFGASDVVRVMIGMGKGGRSYYLFSMENPAVPKLLKIIDPAHSDYASDAIIKNLGLATSKPSVGHVFRGSGNTDSYVYFLGGGFSNGEIDARTVAPNTTANKLGRAVLILDTDGALLKEYDLRTLNNAGAVSAGLFPITFIPGSFRAQRAYFADSYGSVYALGSSRVATSSSTPVPLGWRLDYSNIDRWHSGTGIVTAADITGIRRIYQGKITSSPSPIPGGSSVQPTKYSPISTNPIAYRVPGGIKEFKTGLGVPPAVGVVFVTGDRNDPMDADSINPPTGNDATSMSNAQYRLVHVFDRQDSAVLPTTNGLPGNVNATGITDDYLADMTNPSLVPQSGDTSYLQGSTGANNKYLGYKLGFGTNTSGAYVKGLLAPLVLNGGLAFSTFKPTPSPVTCQGSGTTTTYRLCDVLTPQFKGGTYNTPTTGAVDKALATCSGIVFTWNNLAGDFGEYGSTKVLQAGQMPTAPGGGGGAGAPPTGVQTKDFDIGASINFMTGRSWRIVR